MAKNKNRNEVWGEAIKRARTIKGALGGNKFQEVLGVLGYDFSIQLKKIEKV